MVMVPVANSPHIFCNEFITFNMTLKSYLGPIGKELAVAQVFLLNIDVFMLTIFYKSITAVAEIFFYSRFKHSVKQPNLVHLPSSVRAKVHHFQ